MKKIIALLLIVAILGAGVLFAIILRTNSTVSTIYDEFSFISEDEKIDSSEFDRIDGQFYLSLDYIREHLDDTVYFDEAEETVIFTNSMGTRRYVVDELEGTMNDVTIALRDPVIERDGKIMIPIEGFIKDYPVDLKFIQDNNLLILNRNNTHQVEGVPKSDSVKLREDSSSGSPIIKNLTEDDRVYVYSEDSNWFKVRMIEGYAGYVKKNDLVVDFNTDKFKYVDEADEENEEASREEPLNLLWDYTYGQVSQDTINAITPITGVNVVCPTWFSVNSPEGDITDRGNIEYINKYNDYDIEVWGYLDNSFDGELTHEFLSSSESRSKAISDTLELVKKYNMTGINIDFEQTQIEDRDLITQFVRELYPIFKNEGITVSVAVTPQISTNVEDEPYDREALAETSDYIMLMAYDQHWSSSPEAGSVAEYRWVEGNINNLLRQIPLEKFVLCLPLYSRIWTEEGGNVTSTVASMSDAEDFVSRNNIETTWDDIAKQSYAEASVGNRVRKIWIEDAESLRWKTTLALKYNLAGVASWRKGFEEPGVWNEINDVLKSMES